MVHILCRTVIEFWYLTGADVEQKQFFTSLNKELPLVVGLVGGLDGWMDELFYERRNKTVNSCELQFCIHQQKPLKAT